MNESQKETRPLPWAIDNENSTSSKERHGLHALYYPFSRAMDTNSLKQQLLLFDTISFVDPVTSESWRAKLFRDLETEQSKKFRQYRQFHQELPSLIRDGIIVVHDPSRLPTINDPEVTASIISDLVDPNWVRSASKPQSFDLPFIMEQGSGRPTWQIFYPKMPRLFIQMLTEQGSFRKHLIEEGDETSSWSLSYSAGSAVALNTHLAAAEALGCVPLTDSKMHHGLLLRKVTRNASGQNDPNDSKIRTNIRGMVARLHSSLLNDLLPGDTLMRLSIDDIRKFREATAKTRREFFNETEKIVTSKLVGSSEFAKADVALQEIAEAIKKDVRAYNGEMQTAKEKLWPTLLSHWNVVAAAAPVFAAAITGGAHFTLAASILPGVSIVKTFLENHFEKRAIRRKLSPTLTYLTRLKSDL